MSDPRTIEMTLNADAAISKNHIVKLVSPGAASYEPGSGYVEQSAAAGSTNIPFGVAHIAAAAADDPVRVVAFGEAYIMAGGTFAPGDPLKSDSSGHAVKATSTGQNIVGFALQDGASGKVSKMFVRPQLNATVPA